MQAAFEDVEFCVRARKAGVPVTYEPDAIVRHHYDCTWLGLFRCGMPLMPLQWCCCRSVLPCAALCAARLCWHMLVCRAQQGCFPVGPAPKPAELLLLHPAGQFPKPLLHLSTLNQPRADMPQAVHAVRPV